MGTTPVISFRSQRQEQQITTPSQDNGLYTQFENIYICDTKCRHKDNGNPKITCMPSAAGPAGGAESALRTGLTIRVLSKRNGFPRRSPCRHILSQVIAPSIIAQIMTTRTFSPSKDDFPSSSSCKVHNPWSTVEFTQHEEVYHHKSQPHAEAFNCTLASSREQIMSRNFLVRDWTRASIRIQGRSLCLITGKEFRDTMSALDHNQKKSAPQLVLISAVVGHEHKALLRQIADATLFYGRNFNHSEESNMQEPPSNHKMQAPPDSILLRFIG